MTQTTHASAQQRGGPENYGRSMRFGVLGPIEVTNKRRRITTGGPKQRTVLALLIANAGSMVSTDSLVQGVYGEDAPYRRSEVSADVCLQPAITARQ